MSPPACAITPRHQRLARTPRRNRRPLGSDRPPQAQIRQDHSRSRSFWRRGYPQACEVEDRDEILRCCASLSDEAAAAYRTAASALSAERKAAAAKLAKLAEAQINSPAMKVRFEVVVAGQSTNPTGPRTAGTSLNTASRPIPVSRSSPCMRLPRAGKCPASCWPSKSASKRAQSAEKEDAHSGHWFSMKSTSASATRR